MFTKEPQSLDFLQARFCTQPNVRKQNLIFYGDFTFISLGLMWKIMTQNVNFPIWPVQYLACQTSQRMYKVTLVVNKGHMVYPQFSLS